MIPVHSNNFTYTSLPGEAVVDNHEAPERIRAELAMLSHFVGRVTEGVLAGVRESQLSEKKRSREALKSKVLDSIRQDHFERVVIRIHPEENAEVIIKRRNFLAYSKRVEGSEKQVGFEKMIDDRMFGMRNLSREEVVSQMAKEMKRELQERDRYTCFCRTFSGVVRIASSKFFLFEDIFNKFIEVELQNSQYWKEIAIEKLRENVDFQSEGDKVVKISLLDILENRMLNQWDDLQASQLFVILMNMLQDYRKVMAEEGQLVTYFERFNAIMSTLLDTLATGCSYYQIAGLRTILTESLTLHRRLLEKTGIESVRDVIFTLALENIRTNLIREQIVIQARKRVERFSEAYSSKMSVQEIEALANKEQVQLINNELTLVQKMGANGYFSASDIKTIIEWQPDVKEAVELEFVIRRELLWTTDRGKAHFFESSDPNLIRLSAVNPVVEAVRVLYNPINLIIEDMVKAFPMNRALYADIASWYVEQGLEFRENMDLLGNKKLQEKLKIEGVDPHCEYIPHFSEKAIQYYMISHGIFIKQRDLHQSLPLGGSV